MTDSATTVSGVASFISSSCDSRARWTKLPAGSARSRWCGGGHRGGPVGKWPKINPLTEHLPVTVNEGFFRNHRKSSSTEPPARSHASMKRARTRSTRRQIDLRSACEPGIADSARGNYRRKPEDCCRNQTSHRAAAKAAKRSTFFFVAEPTGRKPKIGWDDFKNMMKRLGDHSPIDIH